MVYSNLDYHAFQLNKHCGPLSFKTVKGTPVACLRCQPSPVLFYKYGQHSGCAGGEIHQQARSFLKTMMDVLNCIPV